MIRSLKASDFLQGCQPLEGWQPFDDLLIFFRKEFDTIYYTWLPTFARLATLWRKRLPDLYWVFNFYEIGNS